MRSSSPFMAKAVTATTGMRLQILVVLEPFGDFESGDFRQLDVHQDQIGPMFAREIERLDAVARADSRVAVGFQQIVEELHIELVVLHDQDGFGHPPIPSPVRDALHAAASGSGSPVEARAERHAS